MATTKTRKVILNHEEYTLKYRIEEESGKAICESLQDANRIDCDLDVDAFELQLTLDEITLIDAGLADKPEQVKDDFG